MNIFILDSDIHENAKSHCNKHIVKMSLESAQIACTAHYNLGFPRFPGRYKPAYTGHPCVKWASESMINLSYVCRLGLALCKEYSQRYNAIHSCEDVLEFCLFDLPPKLSEPIDYALAIKPEHRRESYKPRLPLNDAIQEYRAYYIADKTPFASWPDWRGSPDWFHSFNSVSTALHV